MRAAPTSWLWLFGKCRNCRKFFLFGHHNRLGNFCSRQCLEYCDHPGFCESCLSSTSPESAGNTSSVNGMIGALLRWRSDRCSRCGSVVQHKIYTVIVPLVPMGIYRVKYYSPNLYYSRRLSPEQFGKRRLRKLYGRHYGAVAGLLVLTGALIHAPHVALLAFILTALLGLIAYIYR